MSELIARRTSTIPLSKDAKSKNLQETVGKLSAIKVTRPDVAPLATGLSVKAPVPSVASKDMAVESKPLMIVNHGGALKSLKIVATSEPQKEAVNDSDKIHADLPLRAVQEKAPISRKPSENKPQTIPARNIQVKTENRQDLARQIIMGLGTVATSLWCIAAGYYVESKMGLSGLVTQQPHILGGFLAGILAPLALLWVALGGVLRLLEGAPRFTIPSIPLPDFGGFLNKTDQRFNAFSSKLDGQVQKLSDLSSRIEREMMSSAAKIKTPAIDLSVTEQSLEAVLKKTQSIETRLEQRIDALSSVLGKLDGKIDSIEDKGKLAADKIDQSLSSAVAETETVSQKIMKGILSLSKVTAEANTSLDLAMKASEEKTAALAKAGSNVTGNIKDVLAEMEKTQKALEGRLDGFETRLVEPLKEISKLIETVDTKHAAIEDVLTKRIESLNTASARAGETVTTIRDGLRNQTQDLSMLVGQIAGHSKSIQSMMTSQKGDMDQMVSGMLSRIGDVGSSLQLEAERLNDIVARTEKNIESLKNKIAAQSGEVSSDTGKITESLETMERVIEQKVKALIEKSMEAKTAVEGATSSMEKSADRITPLAARATESMDQTRSRFEKMSERFDQDTVSALDKMSDFGKAFEQSLSKLSEGAQHAMRALTQSGDVLDERAQDIDRVTKSARERLEEMYQALKNQSQTIDLSADKALARMESVQQSLQDQFGDLNETIGESLAQIENAGSIFGKQTAFLKESSDSAMNSLSAVGAKTEEQAARIQTLASQNVENISKLVESIKVETAGLQRISVSALDKLSESAKLFGDQAQSIDKAMKTSLTTTQKYVQALGQQNKQVTDQAEMSAERIKEAMAELARKMLEVDEMGDKANKTIETSRVKLADETDYLADVSIKAVKVVDEAAASYIRQSHALFKATQEADKRAKEIDESRARKERDNYLHTAKFVLESLHSLSVDIMRGLDGKIQEKSWKNFQKGDLTVFTRALLERKDKIAMDKARDKYRNDHEFRSYINRFVQQFESLYQQALEADYGDLLAQTFATSDIGRLYDLLCQIAGREEAVILRKAA